MLMITLKIWGTCIVLTVASMIAYDYPKKEGGTLDVLCTMTTFALVLVDIILFFVLVLMGIWV